MTIWKKISKSIVRVVLSVLGVIVWIYVCIALFGSGWVTDVIGFAGIGLAAYLFFFKKKKKMGAQATTYQNTCSCGNVLLAETMFCGACGKNVKENEPTGPKICSCGNTPEVGAKFCNACGRRI